MPMQLQEMKKMQYIEGGCLTADGGDKIILLQLYVENDLLKDGISTLSFLM